MFVGIRKHLGVRSHARELELQVESFVSLLRPMGQLMMLMGAPEIRRFHYGNVWKGRCSMLSDAFGCFSGVPTSNGT